MDGDDGDDDSDDDGDDDEDDEDKDDNVDGDDTYILDCLFFYYKKLDLNADLDYELRRDCDENANGAAYLLHM